MNKFLKILAYDIAVIIVCVSVGTWLACHMPWWVLIPMMMIAVCGAAYVDYQGWVGRK